VGLECFEMGARSRNVRDRRLRLTNGKKIRDRWLTEQFQGSGWPLVPVLRVKKKEAKKGQAQGTGVLFQGL